METKLIYYSIGDWGATPMSINQVKYVANVMSNYSYFHIPQFIVSLGGNFYENGVKDIHDTKWDTAWYSMFIKPYPQLKYMKWFSILGNHDYGGGVNSVLAEIEMTQHCNNWVMPNYEYFSYDELSNSYHIFLDTIKIYPELYDNTKQLYKNHKSVIKDSLLFLENCLIDAKNKNSRWIFVYGHYHILSNGYYGNYKLMIERLFRLLKQYKVDVYFSGHEHNFQFMKYDGIYFCVNGGGAYKADLTRNNVNCEVRTLYNSTNNGFLIHKVSDNFTHLQYINASNIVEFDYHIAARPRI